MDYSTIQRSILHYTVEVEKRKSNTVQNTTIHRVHTSIVQNRTVENSAIGYSTEENSREQCYRVQYIREQQRTQD